MGAIYEATCALGKRSCTFPILMSLSVSLTGSTATAQDMVRLRRDLFSNYSRGIVPVHNQSESAQVHMDFFLIMIHELVSLASCL